MCNPNPNKHLQQQERAGREWGGAGRKKAPGKKSKKKKSNKDNKSTQQTKPKKRISHGDVIMITAIISIALSHRQGSVRPALLDQQKYIH